MSSAMWIFFLAISMGYTMTVEKRVRELERKVQEREGQGK